jgi:hypothetical protein
MSERKHGQTIYESDYPYETQSCNGTEYGWSVEARYVYPDPLQCGKIVIDNRWTRIHFPETPPGLPGVPVGGLLHRQSALAGYLSYQAAQALRWWCLSDVMKDMVAGCLETRLVKHEISYSVKVKAVSAHDNLGGDLAKYSANRPIDMQGEGRKPKQ